MAIDTNELTVEKANKSNDLTPVQTSQSTADHELVSKLRNLFFQARKYRQPLVNTWRKNYRLLRNKTWSALRADWLPSPEVPEIYPIVASRVGWMTDQRPELEVIPAIQPHSSLYESYSKTAFDLQTVLQTNWQVNHFDSEVEKVLWDGDTYGIGYLKSTWDSTLDNGLGNPTMCRVDPFTLYVDPQATSFETANYIMEAYTSSLQEADRRWPGAAKLLSEVASGESIDKSPTILDQGSNAQPPHANPGAMAPNTSIRYGLPGQSRISMSGSQYLDRGITIFECWIREHYIVDSDETEAKKEVVDGWRCIVMAGGKILMNESAMDLWNHGRHPYSRYVPHDQGELYGVSIVDLLTPSQYAINRLLAALQQNVELTGNPIFLQTARSGIARTTVTNRPGQKLTTNDPNGASWLNPPPISPVFLQLIQFYIAEMGRVAGQEAIMRGAAPAGRNSTDTIDAIQDSGAIRIRMALRNLEYCIREQGQLQASLITEFYDTPRMVAATGNNGQNTSLLIKARHFYVPIGENKYEPLKFDLLVHAGSQNATSATARRQDAIQLFAMGALDAQAILQIFNWPNRDEIIKRIQAAKAAQQFQAPGARQRAKRTQ